jgi:hypothetical protein
MVQAPTVAAGAYEFIDDQVSSGSDDFVLNTFADAVDFADYSEFLCVVNLGTTDSRDMQFFVGDTSEGGVLTSDYNQNKCDNNAGTWTIEANTGRTEWAIASHPRIDSADGVSGWFKIFLGYFNDGTTRLMMNSMWQGQDSVFMGSGYNSTEQTDLKYMLFRINGTTLVSGSNINMYKLKRS